MRREFERNRYVSDPKVIDVLIQKGRQSWQETMNCWSQEPHILGILLAPKDRPQRTFLEKFYEGACVTTFEALGSMNEESQVGTRIKLYLQQQER